MYKILTRLHTQKSGVFRFHMIQDDQGNWVEYQTESRDDAELEAIKLLERVGCLDLRVVQDEPYYIDLQYSEDPDFDGESEGIRALSMLNFVGWGDLRISDNKPFSIDLIWGKRPSEEQNTHNINITAPSVCQCSVRHMSNIISGTTRSVQLTFVQPIDSFHLVINGEEYLGIPSWIDYTYLNEDQCILTFNGITQDYEIEIKVDGDFDMEMISIDEEGNIYHSITEALQQSNTTVKLLNNEQIKEPISTNKNISLDLMGYTLEGDINGSTIALSDEGKGDNHIINIFNSSSEEGLIIGGFDTISSGDTYEVNIGKNVHIVANNPLYFKGTGVEGQYVCNLEGILEASADSGYGVFQGNGNAGKGGSVLNINGGQLINPSSNGVGIYQPQDGIINLYDGLIEGYTAVSMKRGQLNVYGGVIHSFGPCFDPAEANNDGTEDTGAAISLTSNDGYPGDMKVNIENGEIISDYSYALYEGIAMKNDKPVSEDSHVNDITITNGRFYGGSGALNIKTAQTYNIIGGKYNTDIDTYIKEPYTIGVNHDEDRHDYPYVVKKLS